VGGRGEGRIKNGNKPLISCKISSVVAQKNSSGPLNILITVPLDDSFVRQIKSIDKRIHLTNIFDMMMAELKGDVSARDKQAALLADAEIIFGFGLPGDVIRRAPKLKWIQTTSAGVDRYLSDDLCKSSVTLTNVRGMHAAPVSEFVLGEMLMFAKGSQQCFQQKQMKQWKPFMPSVLHSKTVGIVGLGGIGREIGRLSRAFGMRVLATHRRARRTDHVRYVDQVYPVGDLLELLGESDFVVLALPLTPETFKIFGEREFRRMKPTAYLINIARGKVIDEEALIRALEENWIAGAGLDVFETEPLPPDNRLWQLSNVIFSPHVAGGMERYTEQATAIFCENLRRYIESRRLTRIVNKKKGY
jgi:D-2-hydroxyacid dehydrogenase (NADP+)